jgi:cytochrome oxidase assembly protein ShyY1
MPAVGKVTTRKVSVTTQLIFFEAGILPSLALWRVLRLKEMTALREKVPDNRRYPHPLGEGL